MTPVPAKWIERGDVVPLFRIVKSAFDALATVGMKLSVTVVDCPGARMMGVCCEKLKENGEPLGASEATLGLIVMLGSPD